MRARPTIILLIIAAAAAAYFFLIEQPRNRERLASDSEALRLTTVSPDDVHRVSVTRPDVTLEFERQDSGWRMVKPFDDVAEEASVNILLHAITNATIERVLGDAATDLDGFGLAPPQMTVQLTNKKGEPLVSLDVGTLTMTHEFAFARKPGSPDVLLVATGIRRYALRDVFTFRSKIVADFEEADLDAVEIAGSTSNMQWQQVEEGVWFTVVDGDTVSGDREGVSLLLSRLRTLRATDIRQANPELRQHYFDAPAGVVVLHLRDGGRRRLEFSDSDSAYCYLSSSAQPQRIVRVEAHMLDLFGYTLDDLRDRHVVRFNPETIAKIALQTEKLSVSIVKRGPQWTFTNPGFGDIDQAAVSVLLKELENLKFREIIEVRLGEPSRYGLDPAPYTLTLHGQDERAIDRVTAATIQSEGRVRFATSLSSQHLGLLDTEPLDEIEALFDDFRQR
jgi:hypothetical protein